MRSNQSRISRSAGMLAACIGLVGLGQGGARAGSPMSLDVGVVTLRAGQPEQVVDFTVLNASDRSVAVEGIEFNIQVGEGGSVRAGQGSGPAISGVGLVEGCVFQANSLGTQEASGSPQSAHPWLGIYSAVTATGAVAIAPGATARVARVTFDTQGLGAGDWSLRLAGTLNGPTRFVNVASGGLDGTGVVPIEIRDGTLRVVESVPPPVELPTWVIGRDAAGEGVLIGGSAVGSGLVLQFATSLDSAWTDVDLDVLRAGGDGVVRLPRPHDGESARFYRWVRKLAP